MAGIVLRLGIAASCALAAAVLGHVLLKDPGTPAEAAPPPVSVRVATRAFEVGTFLDGARAPFTAWSGPVSTDMIRADQTDDADVVGSVVVAPIAVGEPILRSRLLTPGQEGFLAAVLRPGLRAISVGVDAVSGNAGHIFPGDRVDVILTQDLSTMLAGEHRQRLATETILEDVRVIAVDQNLNENMKQRDPEKVARTITLEVGQADAQRVALAANLGKLSLSLRSLLRPTETSGEQESPSGPLWAKDVSSILRNLPADDAPAPVAAEIAVPVRVLRGAASAPAPQ